MGLTPHKEPCRNSFLPPYEELRMLMALKRPAISVLPNEKDDLFANLARRSAPYQARAVREPLINPLFGGG
jgi:hypothetical protein